MKTIFRILVIAILMTSCSETSNSVKFGKQPLDLENCKLDINIPEFFSDEKNFDEASDLYIEVEEDKILNETDSIGAIGTTVVNYDVKKNEKKLKLAKLGSVTFENINFLTDLKDEKVFIISAIQDSVTKQQTEELIQTISKNYGKSEKGEKYIRGDFYRWEKDNIVVKLAVRSDSDNMNSYEEEQNPSDAKNYVQIFIETKDFEKKMANSTFGAFNFNYYF